MMFFGKRWCTGNSDKRDHYQKRRKFHEEVSYAQVPGVPCLGGRTNSSVTKSRSFLFQYMIARALSPACSYHDTCNDNSLCVESLTLVKLRRRQMDTDQRRVWRLKLLGIAIGIIILIPILAWKLG